MLRNDYFHGFFKDHSLSFSQIDDDSLLSVIQIFVNEFLMSFGQNHHFWIRIIGLLGPINAFSNLKLRIHNSNLISRIHIFNLMLSIFFLLIKTKGFFKMADLRLQVLLENIILEN